MMTFPRGVEMLAEFRGVRLTVLLNETSYFINRILKDLSAKGHLGIERDDLTRAGEELVSRQTVPRRL